jgi:lipopolysaccharide export system permease protein
MTMRMDRMILDEIIGPFFGSALLFTGLFFAGGELIRYAEYLQQGQSLMLVAQLLLLTLPGIISLTFPMAALLANLLGFGRLSGDSEIVALTATGTRFERIMVPVVVFGLLVSLLGVWFANSIVPAASRGRNVIIDNFRKEGGNGIIASTNLTAPLRDDRGQLTTLVHVEGAANLASGELNGVSIETWSAGRMTRALFAKRAVWKIGTKDWKLYDYYGADLSDPLHYGVFSASEGATEEAGTAHLDTPDQLAAFQGRPEDTDTRDLRERARILRRGGNISQARELEVEAARRVALPFAALSFSLIGAPLGVRPQRAGKGVGFGLSVAITFAYWIALQVVSVLARNGTLPANAALMLPNLVCLVVAAYLIRRVLR